MLYNLCLELRREFMLQNKRLCDWRKQHAVELEVVLSAVGGIMQQNNSLCGGWSGR